MTSKKIFVVFGATGIQGGSVAKAILSDPATAQQFHVRAVTRDPSKRAATALSELGAEVTKADLEDKDALRAAFQDAYAVFAVTNFMENWDCVAETRQGKNVADVCKETGVKHLIWSSLPHISKISNGNLTAAVHFDSKALVDEHIRSLSIPHTIIRIGTYTNFLLDSLASLSTKPPKYGLFFPEPASTNTELPLIDATADVGKFVKGILLNPEKSLGRTINAAERGYTIGDVVDILNRHGVDVVFQAISQEDFKAGITATGAPGFFADDVSQVIQFGVEYGFFYGGGLEEGHELLKEPLTSFEEALKASETFANLLKK